MGERELSLLRIAPDQARRAADFFESYGRTVPRGPGSGPSGRVRGPAGPGDPDWAAVADRATSLRIAGQWAMLFDPPRARRLLASAGRTLHELGHGLGSCLRVAYDAERPGTAQVAARLEGMAGRYGLLDGPRDVDSPPGPLAQPQQQAYLLVAAVGLLSGPGPDLPPTAAPVVPSGEDGEHGEEGEDGVADEDPRARLRRDVRLLTTRAPQRRGVVDVGALGTPIRVYWDIASQLLGPGPDAMGVIIGHLRSMAERYGGDVQRAMANDRLWSNGAAPVDVCDLDITSLAVISARVLGVRRFRAGLREARDDLPGLGSVAFGVADDMLAAIDG